MSGETWTNEQAKRLWAMSISPVRSSPERIKGMINYFRTPGSSVFAITEGDAPVHASKPLARKIRDYVLDGSPDWVLAETSDQPDRGYDSEWRSMLISNAAEFSQAVDAYRQDLAVQIQSSEISLGLRAGFRPAKVTYGPSHRPFVECVFSRDSELAGLRSGFESALKSEDLVGAQELSENIGMELVNRIAI